MATRIPQKNLILGIIFGAVGGLVLGPALFDDTWVGVGFGILVGIAIGSVLDNRGRFG